MSLVIRNHGAFPVPASADGLTGSGFPSARLPERFLQARQIRRSGAQLLVWHLRERYRGGVVRLVQVAHGLVQIEQPGDDLALALLLLQVADDADDSPS